MVDRWTRDPFKHPQGLSKEFIAEWVAGRGLFCELASEHWFVQLTHSLSHTYTHTHTHTHVHPSARHRITGTTDTAGVVVRIVGCCTVSLRFGYWSPR